MAYYTITLHCSKCQSNFRINNVSPVVTNGTYKYCCNCGSDKVGVLQDHDKDYWESLAEHYDMSTESIMQFFDLWEQDRTGKSFAEFVRVTKRLLKQISAGGAVSSG